MSKEDAIRFVKDPEKKEKVKDMLEGKGRDDIEIAMLFAEVARENGEDISLEDFKAALEDVEKHIKERTETTVSDIEDLSDDDLDKVAGGTSYYMVNDELVEGCYQTLDGWCVQYDACNALDRHYLCDQDYSEGDCTAANICNKVLVPMSHFSQRKYECKGKA